MKKTKLFVSAAAISMVAALSLTGCGGGGDKNAAESDNTITVWAWDVALKQLQASAEKFKETHPDVEFQFEEMGTEQIYTKLATTLNTGKGLADVILLEGEQVSGYASKYPDGFADLSDIVNKDDYLPVKIGEVTVNDKVVGFPWDAGPVALFYRTDYFEQAGVNPEDIKTWDDFIEAGKKVTATCKTPSGEPVKMLPIAPNGSNFWKLLLTEKGAGYFDAEGNTAVNSPEALECMEMAKKIYDADIALNYTDWAEYEGVVVNQSVATIPEAVWMIGTIKDKGPDQSGKWAIVNMPKLDGIDGATNYANCGGASWAVSSNCKNTELAFDFLKSTFGSSVELYDDLLPNAGAISSYLPAAESDVYNQPSEFYGGQTVYKDIVEFAGKVPAFDCGAYYSDVRSALTDAVTNIVQNNADIDSEMQNAQDTVEFNIAG